MELSYKLDGFEGPLDLLLSLIDKNKVDIYNIPIAMIAEQYMEYMSHLEEEDLDRASEFLVMAATLLDIKAKMLLPKEENGAEEEDPREELVARLLEYRKFKYMAQDMRELEEGSEKLYYRDTALPAEVEKYRPPVDLDKLLESVSTDRLRRIFDEIMKRKTDRTDEVHSRFGEIEREAVQIGDRLNYVRERVKKKGRHSFRNILGSGASRLEIIVTFIAILELIKTGDIHLTEDSTRDDFILEAGEA